MRNESEDSLLIPNFQMIIMETIHFLDLECVQLANDSLEILVTRSVGPRIISLKLTHGKNLFAELPDAGMACPGSGMFKLRGGHRLWHAPEIPSRTYLPDNNGVMVKEIEHGLKVTPSVEVQTSIEKSIQITLPDQTATVIVDHSLKNVGYWPIELAPWAITQMKPGGIAILPQATDKADAAGVLPNRSLAIWPYTDMNSPHIQWGNRYIFIHATMSSDALKLGFPNPANWLGYYVDQTLFVKKATYQPESEYFDFGSSTECYCRAEFIELETLGPRTTLEPNQSVTHRETWKLYPNVSFEPTETAVQKLVEELGIMS